jgi:aldose 1-epimerase
MCSAEVDMTVETRDFGGFEGVPLRAFCLSVGSIEMEVIEHGARLRRCLVPDVTGWRADIVPGFDALEDYVSRGGSTGAICGRYGGRIADASFELDGQSYQLSRNEPPNSLHGGFRHFAHRQWRGEILGDDAVRFSVSSPEGDEGYPGMLLAEVTYRLEAGADPTLHIEMQATTDRPTYLNLIFHGYWNLAGHASGSVRDQLLQTRAESYLPVRADRIPTGEQAAVGGTPFDFRTPRSIGERIAEVGAGYDTTLCFVDTGTLKPILRLADPNSGRTLELASNQPGLQFYTANQWAKPVIGKDGAIYHAHQGAAFETGQFPNAPNVPDFNPRPLRPGDTYRHDMAIRFAAREPPAVPGFFERPW